MQIKARLSVSHEGKTAVFDLEDLGISVEEWVNLSDTEKHSLVDQATDALAEQPYWELDDFEEVD